MAGGRRRHTVTRTERPTGDGGVIQTLKQMGQQIRLASIDPLIVNTAREIILPAGRRAVNEKIWLIRAWLDGHTKWVPDPENAEYLVTPRAMLQRILSQGVAPGDCDDMAMLGAALLKAVGIRAQLKAVGFYPAKYFRHVYAEGWDGAQWQELDISRPARGGGIQSRALTMGV